MAAQRKKSLTHWPEAIRERVRLAAVGVAASGARPSVRKVQAVAKTDTSAVSHYLRAVREGHLDLAAPWTDAEWQERPPGGAAAAAEQSPSASGGLGLGGADVDDPLAEPQMQELLELVENAGCQEDVRRATGLLMRLSLTGVVPQALAKTLSGLVHQQRQAIVQARKDNPPEKDEKSVVLATPEGVSLVRAFEGIVSEELRGDALQVVLEIALRDEQLELA